jgi:hypothetical protein
MSPITRFVAGGSDEDRETADEEKSAGKKRIEV